MTDWRDTSIATKLHEHRQTSLPAILADMEARDPNAAAAYREIIGALKRHKPPMVRRGKNGKILARAPRFRVAPPIVVESKIGRWVFA